MISRLLSCMARRTKSPQEHVKWDAESKHVSSLFSRHQYRVCRCLGCFPANNVTTRLYTNMTIIEHEPDLRNFWYQAMNTSQALHQSPSPPMQKWYWLHRAFLSNNRKWVWEAVSKSSTCTDTTDTSIAQCKSQTCTPCICSSQIV